MGDQRRLLTGQGQGQSAGGCLAMRNRPSNVLHLDGWLVISVLPGCTDERGSGRSAQQMEITEHGSVSSGGGKTRSRRELYLFVFSCLLSVGGAEERAKLLRERREERSKTRAVDTREGRPILARES